MSFLPIDPDAINIGEPVPFDIYDPTGMLLVRTGHVVSSRATLDQLRDRGQRLIPDGASVASFRNNAPRPARAAGRIPWHPVPPSADPLQPFRIPRRRRRVTTPVFRRLAEVEGRLGELLRSPPHGQFAAQIRELAGAIAEAFLSDRDAALAAILLRHGPEYAIYHHVHTALLCNAILEQEEEPVIPEAQAAILCAALTMNLAMVDLQARLWASPLPPTPAQQQAITRHPQAAVAMLRERGVEDETWLMVVGEHHEAIDGSGYPGHLKGEAVSRGAQMVAIADRYGTMVSGRAYREPMLPNKVLGGLFLNQKGFDRRIAMQMVRALGVYPPGSLVELSNHEIAMVTRCTEHAHQPLVRTILTPSGHRPVMPVERPTGKDPFRILSALPASKMAFTIDPERLWDQVIEYSAAAA